MHGHVYKYASKQGRYTLFFIILVCAAITITQDLYEPIVCPYMHNTLYKSNKQTT